MIAAMVTTTPVTALTIACALECGFDDDSDVCVPRLPARLSLVSHLRLVSLARSTSLLRLLIMLSTFLLLAHFDICAIGCEYCRGKAARK